MKTGTEKKLSGSERPRLSTALWWVFFALTIVIAISLCGICLAGVLSQGEPPVTKPAKSSQNPASDQASPGQPSGAVADSNPASAQPKASASESTQIKVGELDGRTNEMSKRIEEFGSHSTQVLNVIGFLIGSISAIVAIGLWQSKQYIDRVVEHYKTEMKEFIRRETESHLNELKSAMSDQFQRMTVATKEELDFAVYAQKEILRALVQLDSDNLDEVIAGCHTISALQDRAYLPSLKRAMAKWSDKKDSRAVEQIATAYQKLLAVRVSDRLS